MEVQLMIIYDILAAIDDIKFGVMAVDCADGSVASGNIDMSINCLLYTSDAADE